VIFRLTNRQSDESVARASFLHVPSEDRQDQKPFASTLLSHIASTTSKRSITPNRLLTALGFAIPADAQARQEVLDQSSALQALLDGASLEKADTRQYGEYVRFAKSVLRRVGASPGDNILIINGRVSTLTLFNVEAIADA
jgi:hypothetical protein